MKLDKARAGKKTHRPGYLGDYWHRDKLIAESGPTPTRIKAFSVDILSNRSGRLSIGPPLILVKNLPFLS